jgi:hypothetical protein
MHLRPVAQDRLQGVCHPLEEFRLAGAPLFELEQGVGPVALGQLLHRDPQRFHRDTGAVLEGEERLD